MNVNTLSPDQNAALVAGVLGVTAGATVGVFNEIAAFVAPRLGEKAKRVAKIAAIAKTAVDAAAMIYEATSYSSGAISQVALASSVIGDTPLVIADFLQGATWPATESSESPNVRNLARPLLNVAGGLLWVPELVTTVLAQPNIFRATASGYLVGQSFASAALRFSNVGLD